MTAQRRDERVLRCRLVVVDASQQWRVVAGKVEVIRGLDGRIDVIAYIEGFYNSRRRSQGVSNVSCDVALSGNLVVRASLLWGCGAR